MRIDTNRCHADGLGMNKIVQIMPMGTFCKT